MGGNVEYNCPSVAKNGTLAGAVGVLLPLLLPLEPILDSDAFGSTVDEAGAGGLTVGLALVDAAASGAATPGVVGCATVAADIDAGGFEPGDAMGMNGKVCGMPGRPAAYSAGGYMAKAGGITPDAAAKCAAAAHFAASTPSPYRTLPSGPTVD